MDQQQWSLMKVCALVLKNRAKDATAYKQISSEFLKYFSRKELIEMIHAIHEGQLPEEYALVDMENEELLKVVEDDFSIIAYVCNKWSKEVKEAPPAPTEVKPTGTPVAKMDSKEVPKKETPKSEIKKEGDKAKAV